MDLLTEAYTEFVTVKDLRDLDFPNKPLNTVFKEFIFSSEFLRYMEPYLQDYLKTAEDSDIIFAIDPKKNK